MEIEVIMKVDVTELIIDANIQENSLTSEYWGSVKTDKWTEIEVESVYWNGQEIELTDNGYDDLVEYLASKRDYDYD